jgi:hypothetical protein
VIVAELGDAIVRTRGVIAQLRCVVAGVEHAGSAKAITQEIAELEQQLAGVTKRVQLAWMQRAAKIATPLTRRRRGERG